MPNRPCPQISSAASLSSLSSLVTVISLIDTSYLRDFVKREVHNLVKPHVLGSPSRGDQSVSIAQGLLVADVLDSLRRASLTPIPKTPPWSFNNLRKQPPERKSTDQRPTPKDRMDEEGTEEQGKKEIGIRMREI